MSSAVAQLQNAGGEEPTDDMHHKEPENQDAAPGDAQVIDPEIINNLVASAAFSQIQRVLDDFNIPHQVENQVTTLMKRCDSELSQAVDAAKASLLHDSKLRSEADTLHLRSELESLLQKLIARLTDERRAAVDELNRSADNVWTRFDRSLKQIDADRAQILSLRMEVEKISETLRKDAAKSAEASEANKSALATCKDILERVLSIYKDVEHRAEAGSQESTQLLDSMRASLSALSSENETLRAQFQDAIKRINHLESLKTSAPTLKNAKVDAVAAPTSVSTASSRMLGERGAQIVVLGMIALILLAQLLSFQPRNFEYAGGFM